MAADPTPGAYARLTEEEDGGDVRVVPDDRAPTVQHSASSQPQRCTIDGIALPHPLSTGKLVGSMRDLGLTPEASRAAARRKRRLSLAPLS